MAGPRSLWSAYLEYLTERVGLCVVHECLWLGRREKKARIRSGGITRCEWRTGHGQRTYKSANTMRADKPTMSISDEEGQGSTASLLSRTMDMPKHITYSAKRPVLREKEKDRIANDLRGIDSLPVAALPLQSRPNLEVLLEWHSSRTLVLRHFVLERSPINFCFLTITRWESPAPLGTFTS